MMSGRLHRVCLFGAVVAGMLVGPALAGPGVSSAEQDKDMARLEALLEAQQQKIEQLEQQVAASAAQDMDQARVDQMKQQIREVLSEQEFRESLMPSTLQAGYDKGFFIRSSDEKFSIKFNGLIQFRFTHYGTRSGNRYLLPGFNRSDRTGFDINRARFIVGGHAYSKDLTYSMTFDASQNVQYDANLLYGWVNYRFMDEFQFKAGIFRLASTRADFGSTATMQFPEYPFPNLVYGLGRGLGVRFWGKLLEGKGEWYFDVVNRTNGTGQTITTDENLYTAGHDNNPALVFRTVWAILGGTCLNPDDRGPMVEPCDMAIHDTPAWNVGFHAAWTQDDFDGQMRLPFNRKTFFQPGGYGLTRSQGTDIWQAGLDTGFKWMGFSTTAEYMCRVLDVRSSGSAPFTPLFQMTGDDSTNMQHGAYVQCGYFLPIPGMERQLEVVARVGYLSTVTGGSQASWSYAGGLNYYIEGQKVKIQTDFEKVDELPITSSTYSYANVNDDALIWRVQLQVLF